MNADQLITVLCQSVIVIRMKVLVTGGAGYIGRHLTKALLIEGHSVRVLDIFQGMFERTKDLEWILGDLANESLVKEATRGIDAIYHLALVSGDWTAKDSEVFDVNIRGLLNLLNSAEANNVKHFLQASSHVVYGKPRYLPIDENHPCHPEEAISTEGPAYPLVKLITERICIAHYLTYNLPVTILRPSLVVGAEKPFPRGPTWLRMLEKAKKGDPIELIADELVACVHVDELARALILSTMNPRAYGQIFNVANPRMSMTHHELGRRAIEAAQSKSRIKIVKPDGLVNTQPYSIKKIQTALSWEPWVRSPL